MANNVSLKSKINEIRLELSKSMEKSGKNTFSKYDYFQLKDFMPKAIALMNEKGIYSEFQMIKKKFDMPNSVEIRKTFNEEGLLTGEIEVKQNNFEYREVAVLNVYNLDDEEDTIYLEKETANVALQAAQPIQNLGGRSTYMKRYMYMDLFEINENDSVEEATGKPIKAETKTTTTKKPATKKVETKPVEEVTPADFEPKKEEVVEKPVETPSGLMSIAHKAELAAMISKADMSPKEVINEVCAELGLDSKMVKESDFESMKSKVEERIGK